ncbi:MAG: hypothetical protein IT285_00585 [Bdellovibrionales bacterium]|nr:hypothetical protein [Bdellovibrionales bacterium]
MDPVWRRPLVFVHGKGGVGRTTVSRALARSFAGKGRRVLWVTFEAPDAPEGEILKSGPGLWELNCVPGRAFEEYAGILIGNATLARVFLRNKVIDYLSKAAPGIREITLLGKLWYERSNFQRVIVDLPATGHALAMFNSVFNFAELFRGGPVHRDSLRMRETFGDPAQSGHLVTAIPEEMPLREGLELSSQLAEYFPRNRAQYLVNRRFPSVGEEAGRGAPPGGATAYCVQRRHLEERNLRLWSEADLIPGALELPQLPAGDPERLTESLAARMRAWRAS